MIGVFKVVTIQIFERSELLVSINNNNNRNNKDTKVVNLNGPFYIVRDFQEISSIHEESIRGLFSGKKIFYDVYCVLCYRLCSMTFTAKEVSVV